MANAPVVVLAGQSNAAFGGIDNRIVERLAATGTAFEFVKVAEGGTSLFANADDDWDPATRGELFDALISATNAAIANVRAQGDAPVVTLLWVQGEADIAEPTADYAAKLTRFIDDFRADIASPGAQIYLSLLPFAYQASVREAQLQVAATVAGVHTVDPVGAVTWDGSHYDKPTREGIANSFADQAAIVAPNLDGYHSLLAPTTLQTFPDGSLYLVGARYLDISYVGGNEKHLIDTGNGDDTIVLGSADDLISTGDNNDTVYAGAGDDQIDTGNHDDFVDAGPGNDTINAGAGNDYVLGGDGDDVIWGKTQDDHLEGGNGDDVIDGGAGDDLIDGGSGRDTASYADAPASVTVSLAISGAQDTRGAGIDTLIAVENLTGSNYADRLVGDAGANILRGGLEADVLTGGGPGDTFAGTRAELDRDRITDLSFADRILVTDAAYAGFSFVRTGATLAFADATMDIGAPNARLALFAAPDGSTTLYAAMRYTGLGDFNGDGHSDLLWRNDDGTFSTWSVGGNVAGNQFRMNSTLSYGVSNDWRIAETFDWNGDGHSDLLWRNASSGEVTIWTGGSDAWGANAYVGGGIAADWKIAGVGDLNGDGRDDIVWRQDGGAFATWLATGDGFTANATLDTSVSNDWKIVGLADFDGDGADDLLWRNAGTGTFTIWRSTGAGFVENSYFTSVGTDWHIDALADFDGDGRDDILWRHDGDGIFTVWRSTGNNFAIDAYVGIGVDPVWQIAQAGDFNDDGRADLLWRNAASGQFTVWQSNGDGFDPNVAVVAGVGTDWHLQAHDYQFG